MPPEVTPGDPTRLLPYALGGPVLAGRARASVDDFVVEEALGYGPSGAGEHAWLTLRKRERNTHDVARALARLAGVPQVAVGYAGLKDRNALTTQSFTVQLAGRPMPDWGALEDGSLEVLVVARHHRKIRRGGLRGNRFRIRLTDIEGSCADADARLSAIGRRGVPNAFGYQRFGRNGQNLERVGRLFAGQGRRPGREQRGLLLSAARAQLFNEVLAARVRQGCWDTAVDGDVMVLEGSQRQFPFDPADTSIDARLRHLDVHPTGPLCGRPGRALRPSATAASIEAAALQAWVDWEQGLQGLGLDADRRALRLVVEDLNWTWDDRSLVLTFALTSGAYATAVLRELLRPPDIDAVQPRAALRDSST